MSCSSGVICEKSHSPGHSSATPVCGYTYQDCQKTGLASSPSSESQCSAASRTPEVGHIGGSTTTWHVGVVRVVASVVVHEMLTEVVSSRARSGLRCLGPTLGKLTRIANPTDGLRFLSSSPGRR